MNITIRLLTIISILLASLISGCGPAASEAQPTPPADNSVIDESYSSTVPATEPSPAAAAEEPDPDATVIEPASTPEIDEPQSPSVPEGNQIGELAPGFELQSLEGETVSLAELRGKPVLINFWATWCPPCRFEMPFLQQIYDTWSDKGLVLLTIDVVEKPEPVQQFLDALNLTLPTLLDTDASVTKSYGITAIPATIFIDADGIIRHKELGAFASAEDIESRLSTIYP